MAAKTRTSLRKRKSNDEDTKKLNTPKPSKDQIIPRTSARLKSTKKVTYSTGVELEGFDNNINEIETDTFNTDDNTTVKRLKNTRTKKSRITKRYDKKSDNEYDDNVGSYFDGTSLENDVNSESVFSIDHNSNGSISNISVSTNESLKTSLTSRQRAILERKQNSTKLEETQYFDEVITEVPELSIKKIDTEEEKFRKKIINQQRIKRKEEQLNESKLQVINKLLYKTNNSTKNEAKKFVKKITDGQHVRYRNNISGTTLSYTANIKYPLSK